MKTLFASIQRTLMRPSVRLIVLIEVVLFFLGAICALMYFSYSLGIQDGHTQFHLDQEIKASLNEKNAFLQAQLQYVQKQKDTAQRQHFIQKKAYQQLSDFYAGVEEKNKTLLSKVHFLRQTMMSENSDMDALIDNIEVHYADGSLGFDIRLIQTQQSDSWVQGHVSVALYDGDKAVAFWPKELSRAVRYQYVQEVDGSFHVPSLSDKSKLKVELKLNNGSVLQKWRNLAHLTQAECGVNAASIKQYSVQRIDGLQ